MSKENVALIKGIYEAFGRGDVPAVLGAMAPDIVWNEAENFPYADRNPYKGPQAVLEGVFGRILADFDGFGVKPDEILDAGDTVVMLGRYGGTCNATGKAQNPQAVHVWRVRDGKVTQFQQYADTLHVAQVMGRV
jgi:ketosteroid isomerase-like protein